jgi:curved DNA-binding protein CbpA
VRQSFRNGYYRDLGLEGLESSASEEDIKRAYRHLAFVCHPDRHPNSRQAAEARMKNLNEAFQVLGDPEKRAQYDDWLRRQTEREREARELKDRERRRQEQRAEQERREAEERQARARQEQEQRERQAREWQEKQRRDEQARDERERQYQEQEREAYAGYGGERAHPRTVEETTSAESGGRTVLDWRTFVRTAALVLIALVLVKVVYLAKPRFAFRRGDNGAPSPADDYETLRIKAYSSRNIALLDYLQSLEPGGANGPLVVTRWPLLLDGRLSSHSSPWRIYVPGDVKLNALNWWRSTTIQRVPLAGVHGMAEITPQILSALAQRRQKILDLIQHPPAARPFTIEEWGAAGGNLGPAFLCRRTPLYEYGISTPENPQPAWMNRRPALIAPAGTRVIRVIVFGKDGLWPGQARISLPGSARLYFVMNDQLSQQCPPPGSATE